MINSITINKVASFDDAGVRISDLKKTNFIYGASFIGFIWAFVDGLIGGAIFAWLYNLISTRFLTTK
jgi:hypothetical protein